MSKKSGFLVKLEVGITKTMIWIFSMLPHRSSQKLAAFIGGIFHDLVGIRTKVARQQLREAFPDKDENWIKKTPREVYRNMAMVAAELARVPKLKGEKFEEWVELDGEEFVGAALAKGKGCIVVSAHLGCWEYHGAYAANKGYPVTYVVAQQSNAGIGKIIDERRSAVGIETYQRKNAARGVISALKRNRLLAIMIDQDAGKNGVFVPFFGKSASTTRGVATFAIKLGAPILMITGYRSSDGRSISKIQPVDCESSGDFDRDVERITAEMTGMIETEIKKTPEQWLWLHRRWKTKPTG